MIIVIEGCDGVGKNTIADIVCKTLPSVVPDFTGERLDFPDRSTPLGAEIDKILTGQTKLPPESASTIIQGLMFANELEHGERLEDADWYIDRSLVLCRYTDSALVYGGLGGLSLPWIESMGYLLPRAGVNILLNAPAEVCIARRQARDKDKPPEFFEGKLDKTRAIVEKYLNAWAFNAAFGRTGYHTVNATGTQAEVAMACVNIIVDYAKKIRLIKDPGITE